MRCPVCKAENNQGPQCRRCKADLVLLFTLEAHRTRTLAEGQRRLAEGRWQGARECAREAQQLRGGGDSRRLQAIACLLEHDFAGAWRAYRSQVVG